MGMYKNKGFLGGEHGHVHGLQEFGAVMFCCGLIGWLVSPIIGAIMAVLVLYKADSYWFDREVEQSRAQGRDVNDPLDLERVPSHATIFWTLDAIADVEFPRKLRPFFGIIAAGTSFAIYSSMGLAGFVFRYFGVA